jgi:quercetin dioxygenase-like cupin family protein
MFVRIYTGEDGESHFEELKVPLGPVGKTPFQAATGITFYQGQPGDFHDWHNAPRRQYVITLSGQAEFTIGDGTAMRLDPGDVLLAEDLTGRGHTTRVVGSEPRISTAIPLA